MMIESLSRSTGTEFSGTYRVFSPRRCIATNGNPYLVLTLADMTGELKAYAWLDRYQGPEKFAHLERVWVKGRLRFLENEWRADLLEGHSVRDAPDNPVRQLSGRQCEIAGALRTLHDSLEELTCDPLRKFVYRTLGSDEIALPFINVRASMNHHHSYPGGLLEHSLECMRIVRNLSMHDVHMQELGIVAALFHDIGKIRVFSVLGRRTKAGSVVHHDAVTLELLAPFLSQLDLEWPDGGIALRYCLTWNHTGSFRAKPLFAVAEAVNLADRLSAGSNAEHLAFKDSPGWQRFSRLKEDTRFWRPEPFSQSFEEIPSCTVAWP